MPGALPIGRLRTSRYIYSPSILPNFRLVSRSSEAFHGGLIMIKAITVPRDNKVILTCRRWHQINKYIQQIKTKHFPHRDKSLRFSLLFNVNFHEFPLSKNGIILAYVLICSKPTQGCGQVIPTPGPVHKDQITHFNANLDRGNHLFNDKEEGYTPFLTAAQPQTICPV